MFCGKCGTEIQDGAIYCPNCGSKYNNSNVIDDKLSNCKVKWFKRKVGIIVLGMLVVVLVVATILISGKKVNNKKPINATDTQYNTEQNKDSSKDNVPQQEETLYCPKFIGQTIDSINQNSEYYSDFRFEIIWEYNADYEHSYVYEQSVSEGTEIFKGTQIKLYVSMGEDIRYEEVAMQYATAIFMYDYGTVKQCLPYNPDVLIDYTNWPEGWNEWENTLAEMQQYYTVDTSIVNSWEVGQDEIFQAISAVSGVCSSNGLNIFNEEDGINVENITKGYQVKVSIIPFEIEDNERYSSAEVTYTVVMYNGDWKVLSDFILDYERQDEAGHW